ncbi:TolB family protein [Roseibium aggregatum]|uniref:TolB family protein n=1 Tax=Roseibium aggregatum TaxID=187304 RepID=UPI003A97FF33
MKSILATIDVETGTETVLYVSDRHLEAPNWTPDGATLIVNGGGRLYRVPLEEPGLLEIDTGFAAALNNDHGLSPDGSLLAISDGTEAGESCIYTLPVTGGEPRRITSRTPSYWHSWSPDGETLAYVGKRPETGGTFQVFTIGLDGGEERQITRVFDHCDGPDYTPDGKWIWFNGERAGSVQLWRVRPDGSGLQQMTKDERVNWFPHPSPDGKSVAYLAYEAGTVGHPAETTVELRLMSADGGSPRILLSLFGGQGTLNVPSWAPDSRRFAYMRYEV